MEFTDIVSWVLQPWTALIVGILTTIYIFLTWNFGYWERQGVKGDKPLPFLGTMRNIFTIPLDVQDMKMYKKHGRVYGTFEGRSPSLQVADPELLKAIFVKDFNSFRNRRKFALSERDKIMSKFVSVMVDDDWKELRNIITPTFTTGKIKQMIFLIDSCANDMIKEMKNYAEKKEIFECKQCFSKFTMDVVATCAFGTKLDLTDPNCEFIKHTRGFFNNPSVLFFLAFLFPKLTKYLPPLLPEKSIQFFTQLLNSVISRREKETSPRKDFLHLLMEAKLESDQRTQENGSLKDGKQSTKFVMTHDHIIAQAIIFIVAGFETTSITLTFTLYNLIKHQDIQEKLIKEIDQVLKKHQGKICYDSIADMHYVEMVISETLRMYPPVVKTERMCEEDDYNLNGIILKKGMIVGIPSYCMHYDEEFFPNPTVFDPERFSAENRSKINPYTYLPFGYGPRNCIGMRFAMMEMKVALANILGNFRIKKSPETEIPFVRKNTSTFLQPESLKVLLEPRMDKVV